MKKNNYIYLTVGIVLLIIWCLDVLSLWKWQDVLHFLKLGYLLVGLLGICACAVEAIPTTENKNTKKNCDICGEHIKKDENSEHYHPDHPANFGSIDYCEKCKVKIIK